METEIIRAYQKRPSLSKGQRHPVAKQCAATLGLIMYQSSYNVEKKRKKLLNLSTLK